MALNDLTGRRFGRLTVVERAPNHTTPSGQQKVQWLCCCECGNSVTVKSQLLMDGITRSCGCLRKEVTSRLKLSHGDCYSRLNRIWRGMRNRCENPSNPSFPYYGGRGIGVCEDWQDYAKFRDWAVSHGYSESLSIDRIDNDKGYSPDNCRWANQETQCNNQRSTVKLTYHGETKTRGQWAKEFGIAPKVIRDRINKLGWSVEDALTIPVRR